jgi:signal transduction histidine kinase
MAKAKDLRERREQTDESLGTERERSNAAAAEHSERAANERSATALMRARADERVDAARDAADHLPEALVRARAAEDEVVRAERAAVDHALEERLRESADTIATLLTLERETTDRDLLIERGRFDEALDHRDEFLGVVSHDLRNLICGISLAAETILRKARNDADGKIAAAEARRIQLYAAHMNRLVRDLLDVAQIDAGKLQVRLARGDVTGVLAAAIDFFRAAADEKRISLRSDVAEPIFAFFDRDRLLQVFSNLLANAIKFTDAGGAIRITQTHDGGKVCISIRDTGIGIPSENLEAVFERFWRGGGSGDRRGCGLGLYIARCIVEAHGGAIRAESEPGTGTSIHVTLPTDG